MKKNQDNSSFESVEKKELLGIDREGVIGFFEREEDIKKGQELKLPEECKEFLKKEGGITMTANMDSFPNVVLVMSVPKKHDELFILRKKALESGWGETVGESYVVFDKAYQA